MSRRWFVLRSPRDSRQMWGDLAAGETFDSRRGLRRSLSRGAFVSVGVVVVVALVAAGYGIAWLLNRSPNTADVVAKTVASTVQVSCAGATGTGVSVNVPTPSPHQSTILTAAHVVSDCAVGGDIGITWGSVELTGTLVSKDPETTASAVSDGTDIDLALVYLDSKIPGLDLAPEARQGDWLAIVGNPLGRTDYATLGIVSAVEPTLYETDAAANEGNSGGPAVDAQGRLLGLVLSYQLKATASGDDGQQAAGIVQVRRLNAACGSIWPATTTCPFTS